MATKKQQTLALVMLAPAEDLPEIIAHAINTWAIYGGVTDLLKKVSEQLEVIDGEDGVGSMQYEFIAALEDWE